MHHEHPAIRSGCDGGHEVAQVVVALDPIDADPVLDRHRDRHRILHRLEAVRNQLRLGHQAGPESTRLDPLGRAADIQVDLVIAPLLGHSGTAREIPGVAAAKLKRERMLDRVEAQETLAVAVQQRPGGDHLGIQPAMAGDQTGEMAIEAVGPVQHRSDRKPALLH